ncbi:MAG: hypothetical protein ABSF12_10060 [Bryobacteraceae bacterium]
MARRNSIPIFCLLAASTAGFTAAQPRVPKGIYSNFIIEPTISSAQIAAYPGTKLKDLPPYPNPAITPDPTDAVLVSYFTTLLNNPAISGLAPQIGWKTLNSAKDVYPWNALDDVFTAVDQWNKAHRFLPPKTIQIILNAGFSSPPYVFSDIDTSVCGVGASPCPQAGSCDGLFMSPLFPVAKICGYTTLFYEVEAGAPNQKVLPMPWNEVYKTDFGTFLTALNQHLQTEPSSSAFNSIAMSGPTASSTEMILPTNGDQTFPVGGVSNNGLISLSSPPLPAFPPGETAAPGITADEAWDALVVNFYGSGSGYEYTDKPFIDEWNNAISLYSSIFNDITLMLTTTTDALPAFVAAPSSALIPAPGFSSDCGLTTPDHEQQCSAVTQVISYFVNPTVGGSNAKAVFEAGMTAARDGLDLGTNAVKWLADVTASGNNPLPGTPYSMSRIYGGVQFSHSFSSSALNPNGNTDGYGDMEAEGCPTFPTTICPNLTPAQGFFNVMQDSYLVGTHAGPLFGASNSVTYGNWVYKNAPMNFLQIYDNDVIYASGLTGCSMQQMTGTPASPANPVAVPPDVSTCIVAPFSSTWLSVLTTQAEMDLASLSLFLIAEPPLP